MSKYEALKTTSLEEVFLSSSHLPELVHLNDPAFTVMCDFTHVKPHSIGPDLSIDSALHEMKLHGVHMLLVKDEENRLLGIIASEDIFGEKPIKLIQEKRIPRSKVLVKMIMEPLEQVIAFDNKTTERASVGHIVKSLQEANQHYALVVCKGKDGKHLIRGLFSASQISHQLHQDITDTLV